jgi:aryl-alcohol dehydrogenase-like predicted oxidoreductase
MITLFRIMTNTLIFLLTGSIASCTGGENFIKNLVHVDRITQIAQEKNIYPAQLALAWVLTQGEEIVTIPGTKRRIYLEQNLSALDVTLTEEDLARYYDTIPPDAAVGARY